MSTNHTVLLAYTAMAAELAAPVVVLVRRDRDRQHQLLALWCLVLFLFDVIDRAVPLLGYRTNSMVSYVFHPVQGLAVTALLVGWHRSPRVRRGFVVAFSAYLVIELLSDRFVEHMDQFPIFDSVLTGVVFLLMTLYTLVSLSQSAQIRLAQADWFWACLALCLTFADLMGFSPLLRYIITVKDLSAFWTVLGFRAVIEIVAMALTVWSVTRPATDAPSPMTT